MKYSYNWLKWYVPDAPTPDKLEGILTYHLFEVEGTEKLNDGDVVFDIKILPNRAHDLLSHQGLAREISSLLNINFVDPTPKYQIPTTTSTQLKVNIETDKCTRYSARIIRGVKVGPSPEWVVKHLESIGQRSINNIVDAANLIMFDCGQPTHAFDLNKMEDTIVIREAKSGEKMITLDNRDLEFKKDDMVIADSKNILGLAGIKGGKIAEVDSNTKDIIIEVANFNAVAVRKTAQRLGIFTDARKRFENDLSPELVSFGMIALTGLIKEICPDAVFEALVDVYPKKQEEQKLSFSRGKISKILGYKVSDEELKDILNRYHFKYRQNGDDFEITVPKMRLDLNIEEDMAEEVGRILGYDKLEANIKQIKFTPKKNKTYENISLARRKLLKEGYSEVMTYVFRDKGEVGVLESASDKKFLRANLSDGLKESIKLNQLNAPFLGIDKVKIFEIGTVFKKDGEEIHVAYGDKKEVKEEKLEDFCRVLIPEDYPSENEILPNKTFNLWSPYPFISRDIAVWVPKEVDNIEVQKLIKDNAGELVVKGPYLFDSFQKDGKTSYAFRVVFQSNDRTLTDEEINSQMDKIVNKINTQNGWQVR